MRLHILRCGSIRVAPTAACCGRSELLDAEKLLLTPDERRVQLPVCCYLLEHPRGPVLVDTGWCREISPEGVYDAGAVRRVLPRYPASLFRSVLPAGAAIHEQLAARGLRPEDLACVVLTHLDPDHVAGLRHLRGAKRIVLPEDEYFWSCRAVYKTRQPQNLWIGEPVERLYYRGSPLGPNHWAIDLFGDGSLTLVNLPGHSDGQAAVLIRNGARFVLLAADAAFSPRNWREGIPPGFGFDRNWQRKSLRWLAEMEKDPGCAAVLCSHDPDLAAETIEF